MPLRVIPVRFSSDAVSKLFDELLHLFPRTTNILVRYATFDNQRITLDKVERSNLLTRRAEPFDSSVICYCIVKQSIQAVNPPELPALGKQKSFQKLLHRLLKTESGQHRIVCVQKSSHASPIFLGVRSQSFG